MRRERLGLTARAFDQGAARVAHHRRSRGFRAGRVRSRCGGAAVSRVMGKFAVGSLQSAVWLAVWSWQFGSRFGVGSLAVHSLQGSQLACYEKDAGHAGLSKTPGLAARAGDVRRGIPIYRRLPRRGALRHDGTVASGRGLGGRESSGRGEAQVADRQGADLQHSPSAKPRKRCRYSIWRSGCDLVGRQKQSAWWASTTNCWR